jgi:hypothetical protein
VVEKSAPWLARRGFRRMTGLRHARTLLWPKRRRFLLTLFFANVQFGFFDEAMGDGCRGTTVLARSRAHHPMLIFILQTKNTTPRSGGREDSTRRL